MELTKEMIERWKVQGADEPKLRKYIHEAEWERLCDLALRGLGGTTQEPVKVMQNSPTDCMRACLATYFGVALEEIPPLSDSNWIADVRAWVRPRGLGFITIAVPNEDVFKESFADGFLIVSGKSARGIDHAVIYKDGALWHDPHPESSGVESVEMADFFYPLSPPAAGAVAVPREPQTITRKLQGLLSFVEHGLRTSINESDLKSDLESVVSAVKDMLATAPAGWISVDARLPELDERVFVVRRKAKTGALHVGEDYRGKRFGGEWGLTDGWHSVTHWMPLPSAPAAPEAGSEEGTR